MKFTKEDLKPGMLCVLRSGRVCLVLPKSTDTFTLWENGSRCCQTSAKHVTEDLKDADGGRQYDIMEVYGFFSVGDPFNLENRDLLWKRVEAKKMTISQIEEALGHPVEIIKEEE